jgi:hypothetical protein
LEDAFINIGMDEERFLKHTLGQEVEDKQEKFTDFSDIKVP